MTSYHHLIKPKLCWNHNFGCICSDGDLCVFSPDPADIGSLGQGSGGSGSLNNISNINKCLS